MLKQSAIDALKTFSKKVIKKTAEASGDLIGNKIANRMTSFKKFRLLCIKFNYVSPEERQIIIDELRLK